MSCVFLIAQASDPERVRGEVAQAAAQYLPMVPESTMHQSFDGGRTQIWAWSVVDEAARGSYWATDETGAVAFNGWIDESQDCQLDESVAEGLKARLQGRDFEDALNTTDGDYCIAKIEPSGRVEIGIDFIGGNHVYHGERNGVAVASNRALIAASFLHGGELPELSHLPFAWFHYVFAAFLGDETIWPDVRLLNRGNILRLRGGGCHLSRVAPTNDGATMDWEEAISEFHSRISIVNRLPDLDFDLALTGGKDSRVLLAGLVASGAVDRVRRAYLLSDEGHPDAVIGRRLAEHYSIPFELEPQGYPSEMSLWETLARHNFHTEGCLSAWDRKGFEPKRRVGDLRGYYGEIYKSHELPGLGLGWGIVKAVYSSKLVLDPHGILTPVARDHCRHGLMRWLEQHRADGLPARHVHNLIHRDCRMVRWVGQAMQWDGTGAGCITPIPSRRLFKFYLATSRREQKLHRFHYELIHRSDAWLAAQSFANYRWKRGLELRGHGRTPALKASTVATDYRLFEWTREAQAIEAALLEAPASSQFFEIYRRDGLKRLLRKTHKAPDILNLKAVLGALGVYAMLERKLEPYPVTMPAR